LSDLWSQIPPYLLFPLLIAAILLIVGGLELLLKIINWFYKFLFQGLWILFGGHPKKAPERAKSNIDEGRGGGRPWSLLLAVVAFIMLAILVVQMLQGSFFLSGSFFIWCLIIGFAGLLYAGFMKLFVDRKNRSSRLNVADHLRPSSPTETDTRTSEEISIPSEPQEHRCGYCSVDIPVGGYFACDYCGATYCLDKECITKRYGLLSCPKCGNVWKVSYYNTRTMRA
jgi:hypothetical protein